MEESIGLLVSSGIGEHVDGGESSLLARGHEDDDRLGRQLPGHPHGARVDRLAHRAQTRRRVRDVQALQ